MKLFRSYRTIFYLSAIALILLCAPMASRPAFAQALIDDFNNNTINSNIWQIEISGTGPSVAAANQQLQITIPASSSASGSEFYGGLESAFLLHSDFDLQVDYELLTWSATNGIRVGLVINSLSSGATMQRASLNTFEQPGWPRENYTMDNNGSTFYRVGTSDLSGTLRLARSGTTITGSYWDATAEQWVALGSLSITGADVPFQFVAWSDNTAFSHQDVQIAFDNVILNSGLLQSVSLSPNSLVGGTSTTGTVTLYLNATADTTVSLSSDNSAAVVPPSVTIPAGQNSVTFPVTTSAVTSTVTANLTATLNGSYNQSATLTIRPIGVQSVALQPNTVMGGDRSLATVTLQAPAAPGDITVQLASSNPDVAKPAVASVVVPAGAQSVTVPIKTLKVYAATNVTISATANGIGNQAVLTVQSPQKGWAVRSVSIHPKSIHGGSMATGTVVLNVPAPSGGLVVRLTCSDPSTLQVPSEVIVPAGSSSVKFRVNTSSVTSSTTVQVTATGNGTSKTVTVTVTP